jgi:hypothetical protein
MPLDPVGMANHAGLFKRAGLTREVLAKKNELNSLGAGMPQ